MRKVEDVSIAFSKYQRVDATTRLVYVDSYGTVERHVYIGNKWWKLGTDTTLYSDGECCFHIKCGSL